MSSLRRPARVLSPIEFAYVIEVCAEVASDPSHLPGYRITEQPPELRHFTARFEPC